MDIRFFQIIVPIISLLFITRTVMRFYKSKVNIYETSLGILFWVAGAILALFPDPISRIIARIFGIESNVNAILFFCIGAIFFFQYKMYHLFRRQNTAITELTRQVALIERPEKETA